VVVKKFLILLSLVVLLLVVAIPAGAGQGPPPEYFVDESKLPFDALPGFETEREWGIHKGAGYRIEVPANWNGVLVMYAHGYRGEGLELTVDNHPLRAWLIPNGYAWAASSYSRNAYDITAGVQDTHALKQFFNGKFGRPDRSYLTGASMGGHITAVTIEQWPNSYDGAMPICGVMGDHELFDYFLDFNLVAAALAGVDTTFPPPADYLSSVVPAVKGNLELFPGTFPFTLNAQGEQLKAVTALRSGGFRPLFDQAFLFWNGVAGDFLFGLGEGDGTITRSTGVVVDNTDAVYQFDTDPALTAAELALNESVIRVAQDPQGRHPNGMANVPAISGDILIPVLSMHNLGDLFVPFLMQQVYAERVAAQGHSDLLVQRAIRDVQHCGFTPQEMITGFVELTNWVEYGVKPAGDDVLDPAAVAAPDYGCAFSSEDRLYPPPLSIPACP
jgi:hypothetical protein